MGGWPSSCWNRSSSTVRDTVTDRARSPTVQSRAGSACNSERALAHDRVPQGGQPTGQLGVLPLVEVEPQDLGEEQLGSRGSPGAVAPTR